MRDGPTALPSSAFTGTFAQSPVSLWSRAVGVGHMRTYSGSESGLRPEAFRAFDIEDILLPSPASGVGKIARQPGCFCIDGASWFAVAVAVASHDPDPLPDVRGIDGCSRNNNRPPGVAVGLQVSEHLVEPQCDVTNNVFSNDPSGSDFANKSAHFRPEMARVLLASLFAGVRERLAGVAAADDIDGTDSVGSKSSCGEASHVVVTGDTGPVLGEDCATERLDFAERDGSHSCALEAERKATDATEKVEDIHNCPGSRCRTSHRAATTRRSRSDWTRICSQAA